MSRDIVESISSIPNTTDNFSEVWMVVERENGRMIERMAQRLNAVDCQDSKTALLRDQTFMDSSLSYDNNIEIESIAIGSETTLTSSTAHGLSSGDLIVLSCSGDFDGTYEVEAITDSADVVLNLEYEGADGAVNIVDNSQYEWSLNINEDAQISTDYSPKGNSSGYFDNSTPHVSDDDYVQVLNSDADPLFQNFVTSGLECTYETYFVPVGFPDNSWTYAFMEKGNPNSGGTGIGIYLFHISGDDYIISVIIKNVASSQINTSNIEMIAGQEFHIAVTKDSSNVFRIYVNEVLLVTSAPILSNRFGGGGGSDVYIGNGLQGYLDRTRLTNAVVDVADFGADLVSATTSFHIVDATLGTPIDSSTFTAFSGTGYITPLTEDTFTGLSHLEGELVSILADGVSLPSQTVIGGLVTLPSAAGIVHIGLGYRSSLETLPINITNDLDTTMARKLKIGCANIGFVQSQGGYFGEDEDSLYEAYTDLIIGQNNSDLSFNETLTTLNHSTVLYDGVIRRPVNSKWRHNGCVFFQQREPKPVHIVSIEPEVSVGGSG